MLDLCVINIIEHFFYLYLLEIVFLQPVSHEDLSKHNKMHWSQLDNLLLCPFDYG